MDNLVANKPHNNTTKVTLSEKLAFGGGAFGANLLIMSVNMYLMFFYTDVFKISAVAAGTLFLVTRVLDSIVDFGVGFMMDRTKSKWGKFRPYVLFGCVPFCVLTVLCFTVPDFSEPQKVIYAYVTYFVLMAVTTVATLPCQAILPSITQEPSERIKLNNFSQFLGMTGMMIVAVGTMPIAMSLGGGDLAKGFFRTMVVFASITLVLFIIWFFKIKERVVVEKQEEIKLKEAIPVLFKNKYLLLLVGAFVFFMSGFTIRNNSQMYYLIYSVQRPDLIPTVGLLSMLPLIITILSVPFIVSKLGKKNALILGMIIVIVSNTAQFFIGFGNITVILVLTVIGGIGSGLFVPLIWGMLPDTVDYAHWKFGKRTEGIITSTFVFVQKASSGLAAYIAGVVLVAVGYIPNVAQSAGTMKGISFLYNVGGSLLAIVAVIIMLFYDLDAKKYKEIIDDLQKRDK